LTSNRAKKVFSEDFKYKLHIPCEQSSNTKLLLEIENGSYNAKGMILFVHLVLKAFAGIVGPWLARKTHCKIPQISIIFFTLVLLEDFPFRKKRERFPILVCIL
jgi:hypothetical protein